MGTYTTPNTSPPYVPPVSPLPTPFPPGQITVIPAPLSEEDVRRVIREEIARLKR
jgi:hypothetical protein